MIFRTANTQDVFGLMKLYQLSPLPLHRDSVMLNHLEIKNVIEQSNHLWFLAEDNNEIIAAVSVLKDLDQSLFRLNRFYILEQYYKDPGFMEEFFTYVLKEIEKEKAEVFYTVTRLLNLEQQQLARKMGFKLLGLFPNAQGGEYLRLVGLQAYFFQDVLTKKRYKNFSLHPTLQGLYQTLQTECPIPNLPLAANIGNDLSPFSIPKSLEYIVAPQYILKKFEDLKEMKSLSIHFYPFQNPNAVIVDPQDQVVVFLRVYPELKYAMVIGERILSPTNPALLYAKVAQILREKGFTHIEMINDAADLYCIDAIIQAGFIPCAYFPALKKNQELRRDYVVFSRCYEKIFEPDSHAEEIHGIYNAYLKEFRNIESTFSYF